MKMISTLLLAGIILYSPAVLYAQSLSESMQQDAYLKQLVNEVDSLAANKARQNIYPEKLSESPITSVYNTLDALSFDTLTYYGPLLAEVTAEKKAAADDIGLRFRTGYRENIEEGIFSGGDIFYLRRFNAGFQWDLLSDGWFDSHKRSEELKVREKMVEREINRQRANEEYERLYNRLIYLFNLQKIEVINEYLTLLNTNLELFQRLHYLDYEPWESVLELSEQKARLQNDLSSYQEYNRQVEISVPDSLLPQIQALDASKFPVIQLNIDAAAVANDSAFVQESLKKEDLENLNYNVFRDVSLAAYADYNIYDGTGTALDPENLGGREYFSVGVNFSIPIPFNSSEKREMVEQRKLRYINSQKREQYSENKEIYNIYYEYKYKTQQFIQLYKDYQSRQETIENYQTLKKLQDSGYSTQRMVHLLLQRYAVVLQMIDLKQQMYLQLIDIDKYLTDHSIMEYASPLDISNLFPYQSVKADGIYIWSETFANNRNEVLLEFLNRLNIKNVYLSLGPNRTLYEKATELIKAAGEFDIRFQLLSGDNELIETENQMAELKGLADLADESGFSGIHLDVEPHTFVDWDAERTIYEQKYVEMLENAKEVLSGSQLSLSVSVPHFYEPILSNIYQNADYINVMVYETTDIEVLKKRIENESEIFGDKLHIAVRPSDFANYDDLNTFVQEIKNQTMVQEVVLHDAGAILNSGRSSR